MEFLNGFTHLPSTLEPPAGLQFTGLLSSEPGERVGSNLGPETVRRFLLFSRPSGATGERQAIPERRILLVEDNKADVGLIREALGEHDVDCELIVINNGEAAIRFIDEVDDGVHPCPHLVILDLNLPRKPGTEVLARMRRSPSWGHVALVVLTSSDSRQDRDQVAALGPAEYIAKPSNLHDFLQLGALFKRMADETLL